jgi:FKBP-type peptidyl-prolyl cis-trans isomerase
MRVSTTSAFLVTALASVHAWTNQQVSRQDMLKTIGGAAAGWMLATSTPPAFADSLPSGVTYEVIKSGDGPKPDVGELAAIRFSAFAGENKIDDIFDTPEPYYTRLGSGGLIPGVESTLPLMRVGDRWKLTIPVRESSAL